MALVKVKVPHKHPTLINILQYLILNVPADFTDKISYFPAINSKYQYPKYKIKGNLQRFMVMQYTSKCLLD